MHDTNFLVSDPLTPDYHHVSAPLLSRHELTGLAIEVLARDLPTYLHREAAYRLTREGKTAGLVLDLVALRQNAPLLKDYEIVKAIGCLEPSHGQRAFLVRCLRMVDLEANARLAAASALTRTVDETAFEVLQTERDALDQLEGQQWGSHFVETINARKMFEARMEPIRADRSWRVQERIKDKIILAFTSNQPLVLDDLLDHPAPVVEREHDDVRQALADSLIAISGNLEDVGQPWNTYSNTAVKLDLLVRHIRLHRENEGLWIEREIASGHQKPKEEEQLLSEEECRRIERNIAGCLREPSKPGRS